MPLAYVAHEAKIVRDRVAYLRRPGVDGGVFFVFPSNVEEEAAESKIPWIRRMLRDGPINAIGLPPNSTIQVRNEAAALFPEATIMAFGPPYRLKPGGPIPELVPFADSTASGHSAPTSER